MPVYRVASTRKFIAALALVLTAGGSFGPAAAKEAADTLPRDFFATCVAEGLYKKGDYALAAKTVPRPNDVYSTYLNCLLSLKQGRGEAARQRLKRLMQKRYDPTVETLLATRMDLLSSGLRIWKSLVRNGRLREARLLLEALEEAEPAVDKEKKIALLGALAETFCREGDFSAAKQYVDQCLAALQETPPTSSLWIRPLLAQALTLANGQENENAYELLVQANNACSDSDKDLKRVVLLALAKQAIKLGKESDAELALAQAEGFVDLTEDGYRQRLEEIYLLRLQVVEKKMIAGQTFSAPNIVPRDLLRQSANFMANRDTSMKVSHNAIPVLQELGWIHKVDTDYAAAKDYLNHAVILIDANTQPELMADVKYELAEMALFEEDFHRAATLYEAVVALRKQTGKNLSGLVWAYNRLGTMYMTAGRYVDAEKSFKESIALRAKELQAHEKSVRLVAWSPDPAAAPIMLPELGVGLTTEEVRDLAYAIEPLCNAYCAQDKIDQAIAVIREVIRIKQAAMGKDSLEVQSSLSQLAYVFEQGTKYGEAVALYDQLLSDPALTPRMRADAYVSRALCYDLSGRAKEALADFKEARRHYKVYLNSSPDDMRIQWLVEDIDYQLARKSTFGVKGKDYLAAVDKHPWQQTLLKVCIDDRRETGYDQQLKNTFVTAFEQWLPKKSDSKLHYELVNNPDDANIVISRVNSFDDLPSGAGGQTTYDYNQEGQPASGVKKVSIRMFCPSYNSQDLTQRTKDKLYSLCLHEIGHALGLDGHSPNGLDIMYWKSAALKLSARDRATIAKLYKR